MSQIILSDLKLENEILHDLTPQSAQRVIGGETLSYTVDLSPLKGSLSDLYNYFNKLDGSTISVNVNGATGGTSNSGGGYRGPVLAGHSPMGDPIYYNPLTHSYIR